MKPLLAILSPVIPYPPLAGGSAHLFQAALHLARFYRVHLYVLADDPGAVQWGSLAEVCERVEAFRRGPVGRRGLDPPAVWHERSPTFAAHLEAKWSVEPPDVVQLEFTTMAQYARLARGTGALVVCTAHNLAFLAQARRARSETRPALIARRWLGALSLGLYELRTLRRCRLVVALGPADAAVLARWVRRTRVEYVPSGVDLAGRPPCYDPSVMDRVLFVGSYLHPPNVEGALWLAREVWPRVRRVRPGARLVLAGRTPPPAIQALAGPDIEVPGTVDNLRPLYARSSMVAAPVFWGSGVRIKLLEALACGLPVVTTALAAEGIDLRHEHSALFAEQPGDFAAEIVRLLDDPELRARLGAAGRTVVERDYDWNNTARRLHELYEEVGKSV